MLDKNSNEDLSQLILYRKKLRGQKKRLLKKIEKQNLELEESSRWNKHREIGDSLLAAKSSIRKGEREIIINNVHTNKDIIVTLNPKCDAVKNAQIYFKRAQKGKRGFEICKENIQKSEAELKKIEFEINTVSNIIDIADTPEFAEESRVFLESFTEQQSTKAKKQKIRESVPYRHFVLQGFDVYIGKNDEQNDELSIKYSKPWWIWLHVAGHAGSHCVIKREKNSQWPPSSVIETVASFSVWFSKAKHTSFSEVNVTESRFVRKRRKSPPGQVIAERCKSIRVSPISPHEFFKGKNHE